MPTPPLPPEKQAEILRLYAAGFRIRDICRAVPCDKKTVWKIAGQDRDRRPRLPPAGVELGAVVAPAAVPTGQPTPPVLEDVTAAPADAIPAVPAAQPDAQPAADPAIRFREQGDEATVEFEVDEPITSLEELVARSKVDATTWYVDSWECRAYQTAMRVRRGQGADGRRLADSPHIKQLHAVSAKLRRIQPKPFRAAMDALFDRMRAYAPAYAPLRFPRPKTPHMLEVDFFDVHFGKLAWARETGRNYDLAITEALFRDAAEDILGYCDGYAIDEIVIPFGNDYFHVDNLESETTRGTRVDSEGRYAKIIETGEAAMIWAVELLMQVAPVRVLYVPGNHDRVASYHACRLISAWFRNVPHVAVDAEPTTRKYHRYGIHLRGYTHGNRESHAELPGIMAQESPDWGRTRFREWHIGHQHKSKVRTTTTVDTVNGVKIRTLQSLSARDSWTFEEGYCGGKQAAEAFLTARDSGYVFNLEAVVREP